MMLFRAVGISPRPCLTRTSSAACTGSDLLYNSNSWQKTAQGAEDPCHGQVVMKETLSSYTITGKSYIRSRDRLMPAMVGYARTLVSLHIFSYSTRTLPEGLLSRKQCSRDLYDIGLNLPAIQGPRSAKPPSLLLPRCRYTIVHLQTERIIQVAMKDSLCLQSQP